jgi:S-adenosylmethionine hydrolase
MTKPLILQSDFGLSDGAVSAMMGVALSIEPTLNIHHNTHDITPFNIHEASYRLYQSISYWPANSVFVSIVDPGVGTSRNSVVVELENGSILVTPNNGTTSHIAKFLKIKHVYEVDILKHRLKNHQDNYTFDGRDLYSALGARLASGQVSLEDVGIELKIEDLKTVEIGTYTLTEQTLSGCVEILDVRFGSLWTSIPYDVFNAFRQDYQGKYHVVITYENTVLYDDHIVFGKGFNDVQPGDVLLYNNSLNRLGCAINQGNFAKTYSIKPGLDVLFTISLD